MGDAIARPSKRLRVSDASKVAPLQCQVCHRIYERVDHLNRHLDSHRNERSFRCDECPAAFNRRDLLLRHQATHAKNAAEGQVGPNRAVERATKACNACVVSKVKCDNSRPCKRCQKKNIDCTTRTNGRSDSFGNFELEGQSTADSTLPPERRLSPITPRGEVPLDLAIVDNIFNETSAHYQETLSLYQDAGNHQHSIPNFFEQIMVMEPDFLGMEYLQPAPNLTSWLPEVDWFSEVDIFGSDFAPAIDETLQTPRMEYRAGNVTTPQGTIIEPTRENNSGEAVKRRHAVFKQSPWFYIPEQNQNAFSDHEGITLDERHVDLGASPHQPYSSDVIIPGRLSPQARDRIFQLVSKTAHSRISIPSFPSAECLDKLIKVGIAKRIETDAWIHPYTFESESSRPEFLTALVVAGCICFGIPSVNKTGLVLHEIVRVSLRDLSERDNSVTQEIQFLQANMLWLDIGAFCGFRQKMQMAESSLQTLVTALRRSGRFDGVRYPSIIPTVNDYDEVLSKKWRQWIEFESYKRLVYHLLDHDIYMTMINHRQPLISYAELTLPLPASKMLWLAPSPEVWKARMLSMTAIDVRPSLRSILQDEGSILYLDANLDAHIARSAYLHGQAAQIWEHAQQAVLLQDFSDPSSQLWLRSRHQKLYQSLQHVNFSLQNASAITCVFHHFLQMFLHVDLDAVTRFAGRCGEEAAHRAYIALQPWSQTKEARIAICHAGRVLHSARHIPPYQNRSQDSLIIYHAIMVLWTYSMMISDYARKTGNNTPTSGAQARQRQQQKRQHEALPMNTPTTSSAFPASMNNLTTNNAHNLEAPCVFLDDGRPTNQSAVDAFILMKTGTPCLHIVTTHGYRARSKDDESSGPEICDLRIPSQLMMTGVKLLEGTHPDVDRETGPPLTRALCGLMEELGGLS